MTDLLRIEPTNDAAVLDRFNRLAMAAADLTPANRAIATMLLSRTESNLAAEAGPTGPWQDLAPATKLARARHGAWPGKKLQDSGRLAASVTPFWSETEAGIGSNAIQAAIQHLGGVAGRGALIPARPYFPATLAGWQAGVPDAILAILEAHLNPAV